MTTNFTREDYIYYARLAEQGERYEDMIRYMKEVSRVSSSLPSSNFKRNPFYRPDKSCPTRSATY